MKKNFNQICLYQKKKKQLQTEEFQPTYVVFYAVFCTTQSVQQDLTAESRKQKA
jgi:hypothetical protein